MFVIKLYKSFNSVREKSVKSIFKISQTFCTKDLEIPINEFDKISSKGEFCLVILKNSSKEVFANDNLLDVAGS